jgi:hypothetical protein
MRQISGNAWGAPYRVSLQEVGVHEASQSLQRDGYQSEHADGK